MTRLPLHSNANTSNPEYRRAEKEEEQEGLKLMLVLSSGKK